MSAPDLIRKAMQRAFSLGQTYWQQADSDSYKQNAKSDATHATFRTLADETAATAEAIAAELSRLRAEAEGLRAELAAMEQEEPVATLHDDGCFTWKRDEFRLRYDRQRAGWRMEVYAAPVPAAHPQATVKDSLTVAPQVEALREPEPEELPDCPECDGDGRMPDPAECARCGYTGCGTITCTACNGTGKRAALAGAAGAQS